MGAFLRKSKPLKAMDCFREKDKLYMFGRVQIKSLQKA